MTPALTEAIAARLLTSFGLSWRPSWERELPTAVRALAARRGVTPDELAAALAQQRAPLVDLAPWLTVGETHFLRIPEQFEAVSRHAAATLDTPGARYAVWSAGCSSGEEPLSVAITLHQTFGPAGLSRADILATDLSTEALDKARSGVYTPWSFRGVPPAIVEAYFAPTPDGRRRASPALLRAVRYRQGELLAQASTLRHASLDVILFRNVAIYLHTEHLHRLFREMGRALKPDGLLLVAPSDPRPPAALFHPVRSDGCAIYARGGAQAQAGRRPPPSPTGRTGRHRGASRRSHPSPPAAPRARRPDSAASPSRPAGHARDHAPTPEDTAHLLAHAERALEDGEPERAVTILRGALFRAPHDLVARLVLAGALEAAGRPAAARHQRRNVRQALATLGDEHPAGGDGVTAGELRQALEAVGEVA